MAICAMCGSTVTEQNTCHVCGTSLRPDLPLELIAPEPESEIQTFARLIVYGADLQPIHTCVLNQDVTRIGRTDAVRGEFADLDLSALFDEATARKVSRKHALLLRSRLTGEHVLRPLAGNTGTQIGSTFATEQVDHLLEDGMRIVLGSTIRMKFFRALEGLPSSWSAVWK